MNRDPSESQLPERSFWDVLFEVVLGLIHTSERIDERVFDQQHFGSADAQPEIQVLRQSDESLGAALNKADEEVHRAPPGERDGLAVLSHELRTSLNATIARTERLSLLLGIRGELTLEQQEEVTRIRQSQVRLRALIAAIHCLTRLDPSQDRYHPTSLRVGDVLPHAAPVVRERMKKRNVQYKEEPVDPAITVLADARAFRHILAELLTDAIDATPEGGQVTVASAAVGSDVKITIAYPQGRTHGGLTGPADLPLVSDRWDSDPLEPRRFGFAICRGLARAMGGAITVSAGVTPWAMVTLVLPRGE